MADNFGRPTLFKPEYCEQARKLCLLGTTDAELAEFFEVSESTINNWKVAYPDFLESIKKGKAVADSDVAASLHMKATGFERDEETKVFNPNTGKYEKRLIKVYYPPDTGAAAFWLKNRRPQNWRDKQPDDKAPEDREKTIVRLQDGTEIII